MRSARPQTPCSLSSARRILPLVWLYAVALLMGCGTLGEGDGGAENLPNTGVIPYTLAAFNGEDGETTPYSLPAPDPAITLYLSPFAWQEGTDVHLLFEANDRDDGAGRILTAQSTDGGFSFGAATDVLLPHSAPGWVNGRVGDPTLWQTEGGPFLLAFAYGDGDGIGLARSADGAQFTIEDTPLLVRGVDEGQISDPSLVAADGVFWLYYTETADGDDGGRISLATAADDLVFERQGTVLLPDPGCEDDSDPCWDAGGLEGAEVRVATTDLGRQIFRMFYSGHRGGRSNLGFASSWDGLTWERFPYNPILADATDTQAPSNLLVESTYLLYFQREENARSQGIALGALETTNPTQNF